jgi:hypothetical protein
MKKGKRVKIVVSIEYRLLITPRYKEREKCYVTLIALRTTTEFSSFHYEIIADPVLTGDTLRIPIRGLRAPHLSIPGSGPAVFSREYQGLSGRYTVIVQKLDKEEARFEVELGENSVNVIAAPEKSYIDIVTNESEW